MLNTSAHLRQNVHLKATSVPSREYTLQPQEPRVFREDRPRKKQRTAKTLLIDNYDSYTYNLFQLISKVTGGELLPSNTSLQALHGWHIHEAGS